MTREAAEAMVAVLRDFPADGQFDVSSINPAGAMCLAFHLVAQNETRENCPTCGTPRVMHRWYSITATGRLFLALAEGKES
jgi:hypothetical protein